MPLDETLKPECETFLSQFRSLLLGTLNAKEEVDLSYAPFVDHHGAFFILTSQLSCHTANLKQRGSATVFFIEDESACDEIYARRRLRFNCRALAHSRDSDTWKTLAPLFSERFGEIIETLTSLPDFELFELAPSSGRWVKDFGKAFDFHGRVERDAVHLNPAKGQDSVG
ncbi:MAG: pyridoxamine 5'-phosphate oxidase family protein [Arenicellales bacterium]|jgi:putative heme iron utilization protein